MDKIKGNRPTVLLIDEHSSLVNVDFSKLERLIVEDGSGFIRTSFDPDRGVMATEVFGKADAVLDDGSIIDFKTDSDLVICGAGRYRHPQYDQIPRGTITGRISQNQRGMGKTLSVCGMLGFPISSPALGADHPSRKREPKGPRKKWGKL